MKNIVKSAIALFVLICITTAFTLRSANFDHAKWTKGPCVSNGTIEGMATGLGDGPCELHISGYYDCVNKGKNTPGSENWSNLDIVIPIDPKQTGGNFKITADIPSQCDHANWDFLTKDLTVTLTQSGQTVIDQTNVYECN